MSLRKDKRMIVFRTVIMAVIVLIIGAFAVARYQQKNQVADVAEPLAQCLTEKGATFYGAYWCPHCAQQKKLFGKAIKDVKYVECAIPGNTQGQTQACKDAGINSYPTWIFADGSRLNGEQSLETLAEKAGCAWGEAPAEEVPVVDAAPTETVPADAPKQ